MARLRGAGPLPAVRYLATRSPRAIAGGCTFRLLAVALAMAAAAIAVLVYQHNTGWMYDARVYRTGGAAALHGLDVYANVPPAFTYTPFAALPADAVRYWGGVVLDTRRVGDPQNVRSQSLRSLLVRWAHTPHVDLAWLGLAAGVAVAALALAVWAHRRGDELLAMCV
ncbi:MAG TPA: glycosyltransferase 87 family protein, partial [Terriglobales bacterium]|nr:glycosyltransferase 87 family protein [Terriglobales bacterium]